MPLSTGNKLASEPAATGSTDNGEKIKKGKWKRKEPKGSIEPLKATSLQYQTQGLREHPVANGAAPERSVRIFSLPSHRNVGRLTAQSAARKIHRRKHSEGVGRDSAKQTE